MSKKNPSTKLDIKYVSKKRSYHNRLTNRFKLAIVLSSSENLEKSRNVMNEIQGLHEKSVPDWKQ